MAKAASNGWAAPRHAALDRQQVPVLYIGGCGRSGSTVLGRMLAGLAGFVFVGELNYLWQRGLKENRSCGCGAPFLSCQFWLAVGEKAFGGWETVDVERALAFGPEGARHRHIPTLARRGTQTSALAERTALLARLYGAMQAVSGAQVIVDSSKSPAYAYLLRRVDAIDLKVVHLVRDSRGVAYSWGKRVERPDKPGAYMPTFGTLSSAVYWTVDNGLFHALRRRTPTLLLRYEELVADPAPHLERILSFGGRLPTASDAASIATSAVDLQVDHTVSGNPLRFRTGTVALRVDDEWRAKLSRRKRVIVTAASLPLLARYGYLGSGRARESSVLEIGSGEDS